MQRTPPAIVGLRPVPRHFAFEVRDFEDPLLTGDRFEDGVVLEDEHDVAVATRTSSRAAAHLGQERLECVHALADLLDRDARVDEALGRLERDQVVETVPVLAAGRRWDGSIGPVFAQY